jgi:hypothetical protein
MSTELIQHYGRHERYNKCLPETLLDELCDVFNSLTTKVASIQMKCIPLPDDLTDSLIVDNISDPLTADDLRVALVDHCSFEDDHENVEEYIMGYVEEEMRNPGTWLNDEVVNFIMKMLQERDSMLCKANYSRVPSHYFGSFFINKLMDCGDGTYNFGNVKRYSIICSCTSHIPFLSLTDFLCIV